MTERGQVREWHDEDGWGVIDSPATPGGCWAHYSTVQVRGYRRLTAGVAVEFTFERADQDGYAFRAVEAWPADGAPAPVDHEVTAPSPAYGSTVSFTSEDGEH